MFIGVDVKYSLFLSDFNETWIFSIEIRKMFRFRENPTDGRTDMTKVIVAFHTFVNAPDNDYFF
jgi:hypothetical protein